MLKKTSSVEIIYFYRHYPNSIRHPQDSEYVPRHPGHFKDIHTSTGCPEVILRILFSGHLWDSFRMSLWDSLKRSFEHPSDKI